MKTALVYPCPETMRKSLETLRQGIGVEIGPAVLVRCTFWLVALKSASGPLDSTVKVQSFRGEAGIRACDELLMLKVLAAKAAEAESQGSLTTTIIVAEEV